MFRNVLDGQIDAHVRNPAFLWFRNATVLQPLYSVRLSPVNGWEAATRKGGGSRAMNPRPTSPGVPGAHGLGQGRNRPESDPVPTRGILPRPALWLRWPGPERRR